MIRSGLLVQVFAACVSIVGICSPCRAADAASIGKIRHIIVIYAENRSFDNLYGMFPGANGIANALANYIPQVDHDATPFKVLPPAWANERDLKSRETDPAFPATLPNRPFRIDTVLAMVFRASIVWMRPLVRTSVASGCARLPATGGGVAWPATTMDAGPLPRAAAVPAAVAAPMNCRREKPFL